jgi:hypothetical protein
MLKIQILHFVALNFGFSNSFAILPKMFFKGRRFHGTTQPPRMNNELDHKILPHAAMHPFQS